MRSRLGGKALIESLCTFLGTDSKGVDSIQVYWRLIDFLDKNDNCLYSVAIWDSNLVWKDYKFLVQITDCDRNVITLPL